MRRVLPATLVALLLAGCPDRGEEPAGGEAAEPIAALTVGAPPVEGELAPEQTHRFSLELPADRFVRLTVEQLGIDLVVTLVGPDGAELLATDRPVGARAIEPVVAVSRQSGEHRLLVAGGSWSEPGRYRVRFEVDRPATAEDRRLAALHRLANGPEEAGAAGEEGESEEQLIARQRWVIEAAGLVGAHRLQADAAQRLADRSYLQLDRRSEAQLFLTAADGYATAGEAWPEANARLGAANSMINEARSELAAEQARRALAIARGTGDRRLTARALHSLGRAAKDLGELQAALDAYREARGLWPPDDPYLPYGLHELGVLYARYLERPGEGREALTAALAGWGEKRKRQRAFTLGQLGQLAIEAGDAAEARRRFEEALRVAEAEEDRCLGATVESRLAAVEETEGRLAAADHRLAAAATLVADGDCLLAGGTVSHLAATVMEERGDRAAGLARFEECGRRFAAQGDRLGEAECLSGAARSLAALDRPAEALAASGRALAILEGVRSTVLREDLRTSFFSGTRGIFDLHIDLQLRLGRDAAAWTTAERARAQALRDLLAEAGAGLRRTSDPALAETERGLQRRLNALESERLRLEARSSEQKEVDPEELSEAIDGVIAELAAVRGELRRLDPDEAALLDPGTIDLPGLLAEVGGDELLLELRLGERASALWAVDRDGVEAFPLPPRREIEEIAREVATLQRSMQWPGFFPPPACELAQLVLAPVADRLAGRRLLLVADGALEAVSFAALPDPAAADCRRAPPLVAGHEIVYLPSLATLATQRRRLADRPAADGWLAVLADPLYGRDDPRLPPTSGGAAPSTFARLPESGAEAAAILAGLPGDRTLLATGAAAGKRAVLDGELAGYRILHFATHGVLNEHRPLLSSLALAQLDEAGRPLEGVLFAHEIYGLELPAELVTLSACETAAGSPVAGEGLVAGLPRAFLYAGAERVLVSLWSVPDADTRELMERFYDALIDRGSSPGGALRAAQRALHDAGRPPSAWAGFVLQGEPAALPPFES